MQAPPQLGADLEGLPANINMSKLLEMALAGGAAKAPAAAAAAAAAAPDPALYATSESDTTMVRGVEVGFMRQLCQRRCEKQRQAMSSVVEGSRFILK